MAKTYAQVVHNVVPLPSGGASVIATAAAGLTAGDARLAFDISSWSDTWANGDNWSYHHRFVWDSTHKKAHILLKRAQSRGNYARYIVYDDATNAWSNPSWHAPDATYNGSPFGGPLGKGTGHGYASYDIDSVTGIFSFLPYTQARITKYDAAANYTGATGDSTEWAVHPKWPPFGTAAWTTGASGPYGLAFHPNLFGTGNAGWVVMTTSNIRAYRPSTDTWSVLLATGVAGDNHQIATYCSTLNAVMCSGGDGTPDMWLVTGGTTPVVQKIANVPTGMIASVNPSGTPTAVNMSRLVATPGGKFALLHAYDGRAYIYNTVTDVWDLQAAAHPCYDGTNTKWSICTIPEYDIFLILQTEDNTNYVKPRAYIWKPPTAYQ
jgi:hypothetical protein